ncbi:TonB-dependent receptor plug domain-containing protein, partial [candidate division KSB1 bacterium]|nr:TonB-dependent receptor plug domain-containing protein [candidate division KSB1 bacterium]
MLLTGLKLILFLMSRLYNRFDKLNFYVECIMDYRKAIVLLILSIFFFSNLLADTGQKNDKATINGIIIDKESGEYLSDANLWLVKSGIGQTSDKNGHFTFKTQKTGLDTLVVKFMGYQTYKTPVLLEIGKEYNLEILLRSNVLLLETINVAANRPDIESLMMDADPSIYTIKARNLRNAPTVGFTDVFRTLQKLPSISSTNEVSPQLYIRGGGADQNLVLLDGACVYYPFHFLGINSSFNHDALDQVMLSPGGFSAFFGGRLSSVLSINSKHPTNHPETTINLHSIGADLTTSGKVNEKLGYLFSGRTSFFDVTNKLFMDDIPYNFQDWLGSITFTPSLKQKWQITVFGNQDHLDNHQKYTADLFSLQNNSTKQYKAIDIDKMFWSNRLVSLKWNYKISEILDVNINAFKSDYNNSMEKARDFEFPEDLEEEYWQDRDRVIKEGNLINRDYKDNVKNSFIDKTLKASVYWRPKDNYSLIAGVERSFYSADYSWKKLSDGTIDRYIYFFFDNAPEQQYLYSSVFKNQNSFF